MLSNVVFGPHVLPPGSPSLGGTFDIERKPLDHLALGVGIHGCVGQNVARAEVEAVLTAIANRVDSIELAGEPVWRPNNSVHTLDRLPVTFRAK